MNATIAADFEVPPPQADDGIVVIPHNREAEEAVIGAILINPEVYDDLASFLQPQCFYIHRHRWIWETFIRLHDSGMPLDFVTVCNDLEAREKLADIGGQAFLTSVLNQVPTSQHAEAYGFIVKEMAERRRMIADASEQARRAYDLKTPLSQPKEDAQYKTSWTMAELMNTEFPEPDGPIPGIIPLGLTILGGRPKRGKSWFMLQAGCTLGMGGIFLNREIVPAKVLYYALEDRPKRLRDRIQKLGIDPASSIRFELSINPLHLGGIADIEAAAKDEGYRMIVIDTIRRAMPGKDFNKDGAVFDDILSQLQKISQHYQVSIVVILHTRKTTAGFDPDPVDDVLGSTGLTASADCVLALYTEKGKKGALIKGRGRDIDEIDLVIGFDPITNAWQLIGENEDVRNTESESEILEVISELGKVTVSTVVKVLGKDYGNTHRRIIKLWTSGKIKQEEIEGKKYYYLQREDRKEVPT